MHNGRTFGAYVYELMKAAGVHKLPVFVQTKSGAFRQRIFNRRLSYCEKSAKRTFPAPIRGLLRAPNNPQIVQVLSIELRFLRLTWSLSGVEVTKKVGFCKDCRFLCSKNRRFSVN
ncbi:MAG: hypothetical protein J6P07_08065, partial [Spirochaetaceae bacterium]|nr:hypothetical protein [Spirochaetaceae bacterium]